LAKSSSTDIRFLPLAITQADDRHSCVGAITDAGWWVRPEPVTLTEVESPNSPYRYFYWTVAALESSSSLDARPEDRDIQREEGELRRLSPLPESDRLPFLLNHLDKNVGTAFTNERSLGLVEVSVHNIYLKRSTGGRNFIRAEFSDTSGSIYDWIIPEIAFGRTVRTHICEGNIETKYALCLISAFKEARTFFTVGLTKPNFRFPGQFRGCNPLVVGIHSEPDYSLLVKGKLVL